MLQPGSVEFTASEGAGIRAYSGEFHEMSFYQPQLESWLAAYDSCRGAGEPNVDVIVSTTNELLPSDAADRQQLAESFRTLAHQLRVFGNNQSPDWDFVVWGGVDIEAWGGGGDPEETKDFLDKYTLYGTPIAPFSIGSLDGCPTQGADFAASCDGGWTVLDYIEVSAEGSVGLLPQLYLTSLQQHDQWVNLVEAAAAHGGFAKLRFFGSTTQYRACTVQSSRAACGAALELDPFAAFTQLKEKLVTADPSAFDFFENWRNDMQWIEDDDNPPSTFGGQTW